MRQALLRNVSLSFYSTESPSHNKEVCNDAAEDDVSNEELKMKIDDFFGGNEEAMPSIFEAILKRELTGKHEENDKLLQQISPRTRQEEPPSDMDDDNDSEDSESDFEEIYDSDGDLDDLRDALDKLDNVTKDK